MMHTQTERPVLNTGNYDEMLYGVQGNGPAVTEPTPRDNETLLEAMVDFLVERDGTDNDDLLRQGFEQAEIDELFPLAKPRARDRMLRREATARPVVTDDELVAVALVHAGDYLPTPAQVRTAAFRAGLSVPQYRRLFPRIITGLGKVMASQSAGL